jgi:tRNA A37 methylthiotransferase MiaB
LPDVLTEIADLADRGVREVTLLGQNVNAYRGGVGSSIGATSLMRSPAPQATALRSTSRR